MSALTCCSTLADLDAWLDHRNVYPDAVRGRQGNWVVELIGPRGGLKARGLSRDSWLEALLRAVVNLEAGVVP